MTESVTDRTTKSHEMLFMFSKRPRYYYDKESIREKSATPGASSVRVNAGRAKRESQGDRTRTTPVGRVCGYPEFRGKRSVWRVNTAPFKGSHFACFPPKLIEPCVKSGSSSRGCCPKCGAPWRRIVHKDRRATRPAVESKVYATLPLDPFSPYQTHNGDVCGNRDPQRHVTVTKTVGWESSCGCLEARHPIPCTIFDPFAGAGTTMLVAELLGRNSVGTDLSRPYLEMAGKRVVEKTRCESRIAVPKPRKPLKGQLTMFGGG